MTKTLEPWFSLQDWFSGDQIRNQNLKGRQLGAARWSGPSYRARPIGPARRSSLVAVELRTRMDRGSTPTMSRPTAMTSIEFSPERIAERNHPIDLLFGVPPDLDMPGEQLSILEGPGAVG